MSDSKEEAAKTIIYTTLLSFLFLLFFVHPPLKNIPPFFWGGEGLNYICIGTTLPPSVWNTLSTYLTTYCTGCSSAPAHSKSVT